jgi:hypothetical protein
LVPCASGACRRTSCSIPCRSASSWRTWLARRRIPGGVRSATAAATPAAAVGGRPRSNGTTRQKYAQRASAKVRHSCTVTSGLRLGLGQRWASADDVNATRKSLTTHEVHDAWGTDEDRRIGRSRSRRGSAQTGSPRGRAPAESSLFDRNTDKDDT